MGVFDMIHSYSGFILVAANMYVVKKLPQFDDWLEGIKDKMTYIRLNRRLDKAQRGLLGDVKPVGDGVWEMREFFGSGYRMYYIIHQDVVIVMLGGGDKSSQQQDIDKAVSLSKTLDLNGNG